MHGKTYALTKALSSVIKTQVSLSTSFWWERDQEKLNMSSNLTRKARKQVACRTMNNRWIVKCQVDFNRIRHVLLYDLESIRQV